MNKNEKYFEFLNRLRESGVTNMFRAGPYLMKAFPELSETISFRRKEADKVLSEWMKTFSKRHPKSD